MRNFGGGDLLGGAVLEDTLVGLASGLDVEPDSAEGVGGVAGRHGGTGRHDERCGGLFGYIKELYVLESVNV
jgi:hypothetical protein